MVESLRTAVPSTSWGRHREVACRPERISLLRSSDKTLHCAGGLYRRHGISPAQLVLVPQALAASFQSQPAQTLSSLYYSIAGPRSRGDQHSRTSLECMFPAQYHSRARKIDSCIFLVTDPFFRQPRGTLITKPMDSELDWMKSSNEDLYFTTIFVLCLLRRQPNG